MPKIFKWLGYAGLFIFSFLLFLYWTFPYNVLKERLVSSAEQQLGSVYDVRVSDLSPNFFTGAVLKGVKVIKYDGDSQSTVWEAAKVKIRAGLFGLIFGKPSVSFTVKGGDGDISGDYRPTDEGFGLSLDLSDFDIAAFGFLTSGGTAKLSSAINGTVDLNMNKRQMIQSSGKAELELNDIVMKAGDIKMGEGGAMAIPEVVFSKGKGSILKFDLSRGAVKIKEFKLADGDIKIDLTGDIFMSSLFKNYRINLKGTFSVSQKLEQAIPILFMIEKQKQPDGSYPITITGRIEQPSVKIGDFTLPF